MLGSGVTGVVALCAALVVCASGRDYEKTGVNVRTVLFSAKDLCKSCWSAEDAELLKARMVLQDIIPTRLTTDFPMVLRYLRICLETLNSEVPQIKLKVAKMALYDALGGYLKSIVIPMLDEAYYAGNVGYGVAAELHSIYGQMKAFLQTDGSGWSSPCDMRKIPTKVAPLSLKVCKHREACDALVIAEQSTPNPTMEASTSTASPYERLSEPAQSCEKTAIVPIPYLDDRNYPCSIAIPFRERTLFGLLTMCSANLLPKYYILTMRCLTGRQYTKKQILDFNHQFHAWLVKEVVPHLRDRDRWYPGFGGVMRILETMKQKGLSGDVCGGPEAGPASNPACCEFPLDDPCRYPAWIKVALICGVVLLILLIIIVIFYWVLHCLRRKWADDEFEECDPGDVPRNVLDKMVAMYCHRDANDDDENDRHGSDTSDESPPLDSPRVNKRRNTKENRSKSDEVKYAAYEVPDPTEDELSETSIVGEHK